MIDYFIRDLRRRAVAFLWPSVGMCVLCYFLYHLSQGDRGILAWQRLEKELHHRQEELKQLTQQRTQMAQRVTLLRTQICPDLLDEQAKSVLGYVHPHDRIILKEDLRHTP